MTDQPEDVVFLVRDSVAVPLEPVATFDARVRASLGARWKDCETVACSNEAYERMERAGLLTKDDSPASYAGKVLFIQFDDH